MYVRMCLQVCTYACMYVCMYVLEIWSLGVWKSGNLVWPRRTTVVAHFPRTAICRFTRLEPSPSLTMQTRLVCLPGNQADTLLYGLGSHHPKTHRSNSLLPNRQKEGLFKLPLSFCPSSMMDHMPCPRTYFRYVPGCCFVSGSEIIALVSIHLSVPPVSARSVFTTAISIAVRLSDT